MTHVLRHSALLLLLGAAATLSACGSLGADGDAAGDALPPMERIKRTATVDVPPPRTATRLIANVLRIELPIEASLEDAWLLVMEDIAAPVLVEAWHMNGMRIGVLEEKTIPEFVKRLPPALQTQRAQLMTQRAEPTALYRSPPVRQAVFVDLTVPPLAPRQETIRRGYAQLLGRIVHDAANGGRVPSPADGMTIELTPHHYLAKTTLHPRMPQEKLLDGRVFDEFAVQLPLAPHQQVVIGLYRVWQTPADSGEADAPATAGPEKPSVPPPMEAGEQLPDADQTAQVAQPARQEEAPDADAAPPTARYEPMPNHFGRQLLTGRRLHRNVQVLLVITFEEVRPQTAGSAEAAK